MSNSPEISLQPTIKMNPLISNQKSNPSHHQNMINNIHNPPEVSLQPTLNTVPIIDTAENDLLKHHSITGINNHPPFLDIETIISYLEAMQTEKYKNFKSLMQEGELKTGKDFTDNEQHNPGEQFDLQDFTTLEEHLGPAILPFQVYS